MKKVLLPILLLFIASGCSSKDNLATEKEKLKNYLISDSWFCNDYVCKIESTTSIGGKMTTTIDIDQMTYTADNTVDTYNEQFIIFLRTDSAIYDGEVFFNYYFEQNKSTCNGSSNCNVYNATISGLKNNFETLISESGSSKTTLLNQN